MESEEQVTDEDDILPLHVLLGSSVSNALSCEERCCKAEHSMRASTASELSSSRTSSVEVDDDDDNLWVHALRLRINADERAQTQRMHRRGPRPVHRSPLSRETQPKRRASCPAVCQEHPDAADVTPCSLDGAGGRKLLFVTARDDTGSPSGPSRPARPQVQPATLPQLFPTAARTPAFVRPKPAAFASDLTLTNLIVVTSAANDKMTPLSGAHESPVPRTSPRGHQGVVRYMRTRTGRATGLLPLERPLPDSLLVCHRASARTHLRDLLSHDQDHANGITHHP